MASGARNSHINVGEGCGASTFVTGTPFEDGSDKITGN
jgi:hypothetical protein